MTDVIARSRIPSPGPGSRGGNGSAHRDDIRDDADMPYGFDDDEPARLLLRSAPPAQALAWAGRAVGGSVVSAAPVQGGTSSAMHRLQIRRSDGTTRTAMLRRASRRITRNKLRRRH